MSGDLEWLTFKCPDCGSQTIPMAITVSAEKQTLFCRSCKKVVKERDNPHPGDVSYVASYNMIALTRVKDSIPSWPYDEDEGNAIGRFMLFYRKVGDQIPSEPRHYNFLLTWEEAQAIIDCFDATPTLHADLQDISGKLSEQLKWQAETFKKEAEG